MLKDNQIQPNQLKGQPNPTSKRTAKPEPTWVMLVPAQYKLN